ncbi:hypothetical protein ABIA39_000339 [Nocardia sp. GAS34]|uniref:hypothetical protein n=1 Tax=unclassified Nocardia TaxID=2637762 RepID=UPI003D192C48
MTDVRVAAMIGIDGVTAVGAPAWNYFFQRSEVPLQAGAAVVAVTTFTCVWLIQREAGSKSPATTNSMRDAIAAGFVVTYLLMVGWSAFFAYSVHTNLQDVDQLQPLTKTLIDNFTWLTAAVVLSYFGADAFKQFNQIRGGKDAVEATQAPGTGT